MKLISRWFLDQRPDGNQRPSPLGFCHWCSNTRTMETPKVLGIRAPADPPRARGRKRKTLGQAGQGMLTSPSVLETPSTPCRFNHSGRQAQRADTDGQEPGHPDKRTPFNRVSVSVRLYVPRTIIDVCPGLSVSG